MFRFDRAEPDSALRYKINREAYLTAGGRIFAMKTEESCDLGRLETLSVLRGSISYSFRYVHKSRRTNMTNLFIPFPPTSFIFHRARPSSPHGRRGKVKSRMDERSDFSLLEQGRPVETVMVSEKISVP